MKPIDYIIIGVAVLVIAGVAIHLIRRKKAGKGGCGCGCAGCPAAGKCGASKPDVVDPVSNKTEDKDE